MRAKTLFLAYEGAISRAGLLLDPIVDIPRLNRLDDWQRRIRQSEKFRDALIAKLERMEMQLAMTTKNEMLDKMHNLTDEEFWGLWNG